MAVPQADFILGMMNPYKGFDPNEGARVAIAAGQLGESRANRRQRAGEFNLENERANSYLGLEQNRFMAGQANELRDKQISAFTKFQAAVDSGDTEQADLALGELQILGVGVEKYGGQSGASLDGPKAGPGPAPMPSSSIPDPVSPNPAATATPGPNPFPSMPPPISPRNTVTDRELGQLEKETALPQGMAVSPRDEPSPGYSMDAMPAPQVARPGAAVAGQTLAQASGATSDQDRSMLETGEYRQEKGAPPPDPKDYRAGPYRTPKGEVPPDPRTMTENMPYRSGAVSDRDMGAAEGPAPAPAGPRPAPARTPSLRGDEPKEAGAPGASSNPLIQGYRLKFKDSTGAEKVIDINPDSIAERQRARVEGVFQPLVDSASSPEERRHALQAKYVAMQMVGTVKPEQAVAAGLDFYTGNLDRAAREKRAGIMSGKAPGQSYGGVEGLTEDAKKRSLDVGRYVRTNIIDKESARYNIKGIREELAQGKDALSKANSPDGLGQFASKATLQKMLMKGSLSDRDVARLESATGMYSRMQQWVNNWSGDGQVPPDVLNAIKRIVVEKNKILRERELEAAQAVENSIRTDATVRAIATPEEQEDWARTGRESILGPSKTKRARGSMEGGGAAGKPGEKPRKPGAANAAAKRLLGR